jgi:hypothetical protein
LPSADRLSLETEIAERLPGGVLHDEARIIMLLDDPRRRETACGAVLGSARRYAATTFVFLKLTGSITVAFSFDF